MVDELFPNGHWKEPSVAIICIQAVTTTTATLAVSLRFYARLTLKRRVTVDDLFILAGLLFAIARCIVACLSSQYGWASRTGPKATYQIPYYLHYFERRLLYALSALFIRCGVLIYYLRLFPSALTRLRISSWVLIVLSFLQALQLIINLAIVCNDIDDLYRGEISTYNNPECSNAFIFTYTGAIGDAVIDAMIYVLPIPYIWGLRRLRLDQRLGLVFVFGIGIVACIFAMLQIPFIIMNYRHLPNGQSWFGAEVSLFIAIELSLGLIAASLPDLRGWIARSVPGFMAAFRHTDDSSSRASGRHPSSTDPEMQNDVQNPARGHSIGGGAGPRGNGGTPGWAKKVKKPDWMRSEISSLFMDSITGTKISPTRKNSVADALKNEDIMPVQEAEEGPSKERPKQPSTEEESRTKLQPG